MNGAHGLRKEGRKAPAEKKHATRPATREGMPRSSGRAAKPLRASRCRSEDTEQELPLQADEEAGLRPPCDAAHERARRVHAAFTAQYGLSASKFPLLRLSPGEWDAPFAAAD